MLLCQDRGRLCIDDGNKGMFRICAYRQCSIALPRVVRAIGCGLALTIAISWLSAISVCPADGGWEPIGSALSTTQYWSVVSHRTWTKHYVDSFVRPRRPNDDESDLSPFRVSPRDLIPYWADIPDPSAGSHSIVLDARGFPLPALVMEYTFDNRGQFAVRSGIRTTWHHDSSGPGDDWPYPITLPFRPLWLGLFVDTVFYAVVVLMIGAFASRWRKTRAARHLAAGTCPRCGYLIRTVASRCPECGHVVRTVGQQKRICDR
jgi:hypothetical protein